MVSGESNAKNDMITWGTSGRILAFSSTLRNGKDHDVTVLEEATATQNDAGAETVPTHRKMLTTQPGVWRPMCFSPDEKFLAVKHFVSANESTLYVVEVTGLHRHNQRIKLSNYLP